MSEHEFRMERYRNQAVHDELRYEMQRQNRELEERLEGLREEGVTWEELQDLRSELLERQNRLFRAFARELRLLRSHWHFQDVDYGVTGKPETR